MNQLTNQLLSCVQATDKTVPWFDQRSAMGLARTWVEKKDFKRSEYHPVAMKRRDDLAESLIAILNGVVVDEAIAAIRECRAIMDEPFEDEKMLGIRARGKALGKPGDKKKEKGKGE